jgi:hypothetical protein
MQIQVEIKFNLRSGHVDQDKQKVIEYLTLLEQLNGKITDISKRF